MRKLMVTVMVLVGVSALYAQTGPAWVPLNNIPHALRIYDILEIPGTDIIIAAGSSYWDHWNPSVASIFRSEDRGQTWERILGIWSSGYPLRKLVYDSTKNIIFAVGLAHLEPSFITLEYSQDYGETWHGIIPPFYSYAEPIFYDVILVNGYLYFAPSSMGYYACEFWRLNIQNSDPSQWTWEFLRLYPQIEYIARLAYKDGKLYVFGKDRNNDAIRIFVYEMSELDAIAKPYKTVAEINKEANKYGKVSQEITAFEQNQMSVPDSLQSQR